MVAKSTGQALVRAGNDSWFFLVADFAFGYALERDASAVVVKEAARCSAASGTR
jgi:branched-chain amino acid transport system substrate-binding protein